MKFRDYITYAQRNNERDYAYYYGSNLQAGLDNKHLLTADDLGEMRVCMSEWEWYLHKRPYFNLFPCIERKILDIETKVFELSEIVFPYGVLEIRVKERSCLFYSQVSPGSAARLVVAVLQKNDNVYSSFQLRTKEGVNEVLSSGNNDLIWLYKILCGICLIAKDKTIVSPVILSNDRRENMTPEEIERFSKKAIKRTGRIGFDVGRNIERLSNTEHYRNGCFAKYYVAKDHELYPDGATEKLAAVMKWRSGAIVNAGNLPSVPTGFKDAVA